MPRYLSLHTLACMTRQNAEALVRKLAAAGAVPPGGIGGPAAASGTAVTLRRSAWSFLDGKMLAEFEAPNRETAEQWLAANALRPEWLLRIEYESVGEEWKAL